MSNPNNIINLTSGSINKENSPPKSPIYNPYIDSHYPNNFEEFEASSESLEKALNAVLETSSQSKRAREASEDTPDEDWKEHITARLTELETNYKDPLLEMYDDIENRFLHVTDNIADIIKDNKRMKTEIKYFYSDNDRLFRRLHAADAIIGELSYRLKMVEQEHRSMTALEQRMREMEQKLEQASAVGNAITEMARNVTNINKYHK